MELEKAKTRTNYLILLKDTRPSVNYAEGDARRSRVTESKIQRKGVFELL